MNLLAWTTSALIIHHYCYNISPSGLEPSRNIILIFDAICRCTLGIAQSSQVLVNSIDQEDFLLGGYVGAWQGQ